MGQRCRFAALVCLVVFVSSIETTFGRGRRMDAPTEAPNDVTEKPDFHVCGKRPREEALDEESLVRKLLKLLGEPTKERRIVNGKDAERGQFPWQAGIATYGERYSDGEFKAHCGGTIISPKWVVTAAHCVATPYRIITAEELEVSVGDHDRDDDHAHDEFHNVKAVYYHPLFETHYSRISVNDIALLELVEPIKFNDYVQPACLPSPGQHPTPSHCLTSGWGYTNFTGRDQPNTLQGVELSIESKEKCLKYLRETWPYLKYMPDCQLESQMCAGYHGVNSPCFGDSGGPLVCKEEGGYTLFGVTAFGFACGADKHAGIFSAVSHHLRFIEDVLHHAQAKAEDEPKHLFRK